MKGHGLVQVIQMLLRIGNTVLDPEQAREDVCSEIVGCVEMQTVTHAVPCHDKKEMIQGWTGGTDCS